MPQLKISTRLILFISLLVLLQTLVTGGFATRYLNNSLQEQMGIRALHLATTIAQIPMVREAVANRDSAPLNQFVAELMQISDVAFVSIGDHQGIRLAHPVPDRIGNPMQGDDNELALVYGQRYVSEAVGSLGPSIRGKTPVFGDEGEIIGVVSVGYLTDSVRETVASYRNVLLSVSTLILLISILAAIWIARRFKAAIYGLEPHQIARLFEERNATLESVREGIIAVNADGVITIMNRAALVILGLPPDQSQIGRQVRDVLPESRLAELLVSGEPEYDRPIIRNGEELVANRIPIRDGEQIIGAVSSFRRKNEIDLISQQLTQVRQYAETLRSQTHEYMNKLHTISGLIQIGASDKALEMIGQETQEQQSLIQLLTRSVAEPVLLGCILGKYNRAQELGLRLEIDPESHMEALPPHIVPEQLVTILGNLLDNAFDANLESGQKLISLSMTDLGQDLVFEVEDQGPGIPIAERSRIFERGYSSKAEHNRGIGLQLVSDTVTRLRGEITVSDGDDCGTRFTVYLPRELGQR